MKKQFGRRNAIAKIPKRNIRDNKSHGGRSLIIAGSKGMWGAAILTATAATRVGSGYVTLFTSPKHFSSIKHPDFLTIEEKTFFKDFAKKLSRFNAIAIGPGLGTAHNSAKLLLKLIKIRNENVIIDADGLNILAKKKFTKLPSNYIMTPHEGELGRLLGVSARLIKANREFYLKAAQKKFSCVVLLKGHKTLVADSKNLYEIESGNVALAKAGTGDVLAGIITGLLAQGLKPLDAACLGAYIHGAIADQWVKKEHKDYLSFMASDLLAALPKFLASLR